MVECFGATMETQVDIIRSRSVRSARLLEIFRKYCQHDVNMISCAMDSDLHVLVMACEDSSNLSAVITNWTPS